MTYLMFIQPHKQRRRRLRASLLTLTTALALAACSVAGTEQSGSDSQGSDASSTGSATSGLGSTAGPNSTTDAASGTQGETATGTSSDSATGGTAPTGTTADPTGVTTGGTTGGTTGVTTGPGTTTGEATTDGATTGGDDLPCETDEDCKLVEGDCCSCEATHVDNDPPVCDLECQLTVCEEYGIEKAVCEQGQCVPESTNCDDSQILCDAIPPQCEEGLVPGVDEQGACWTGACVPAILCNFVPSCQDCAGYDDYFCATDVTQLGLKPHCELLPPECDGEATCECAGDACVEPYDVCGEGDNGLMCNCPVC